MSRITRRQFLGASLATLPLAESLLAATPGRKPVAAVLEHRENWTAKSVGAAEMLRHVGFHVIDLTPKYLAKDVTIARHVMDYYEDPSQRRLTNPVYEFPVGPDPDKVDLLFFGTFTNHGQPYQDYMRRYAAQIPAFVRAGGVVIEMCQWGRYDPFHPSMLPPGMELVREPWSATSDVTVAVDDHPLVTPWAGPRGAAVTYPLPDWRKDRPWERRICWQCVSDWQQMRVLMSAGGGYRGHGSADPSRAVMLEAEHGKGRYIFASLSLDKLFGEDGKPTVEPGTIAVAEQFFAAVHGYVAQVRAARAPRGAATVMPGEPWIGPMLGHTDHQRAIVWVRPPQYGRCTLVAWRADEDESKARRLDSESREENDGCIHWQLDGLDADTTYHYRVERDGQTPFDGQTFTLRTAPPPGAPALVKLAFGSCMSSTDFPDIWPQIDRQQVQGMVLLGDTPYIDSTDTLQNRLKHRELIAYPPIADLVRKVACWGTWDDHDFGANNSHSRIHNARGVRQVFTEYRAHVNYGEDGRGVYTRFRHGPVEVFILDTRSFWKSGPSPVDGKTPTLLGARQLKWLMDGLKASDAPFKVLCSGMIWNSKSASGSADDWMTCPPERDAVFELIGRERIAGVVLIGGDIHVSRAMRYASTRAGYPMHQFITSPMHERLGSGTDVPDLLFSKAEPHSFLVLAADTRTEPRLTAEWMNMAGDTFWRIELALTDLTPSV